MKKLSLFFTAAIMLAFVACNDGKRKDTIHEESNVEDFDPAPDLKKDEPAERIVQVVMEPKSGSKVSGEVYFTEKDGKVRMEGKFTGLTPNHKHAIHLHENADCGDDGKAAGGHWNPTDDRHGKWDHHDGYHKGDIGNLEADSDGKVGITFETDQWCIGCGDPEKDIIGKTVIVHANKDDFETQPTGDAGGRIACGIVR